MGDRRAGMTGFSLMEVLVCLVILTVLATGLLGTLVFQRRSLESGNQTMIAMNLLQSKITEFRSRGAEDLSVTTTPVYATTGELRNGVIEWTITRPELNNESWKQVILSVGWDSMTKPTQAHTRTQDCEFSKTVLVFISQA